MDVDGAEQVPYWPSQDEAVMDEARAPDPDPLTEIEALLRTWPRDPRLHEAHGHILMQRGRHADAARAFAEVMSLGDEDPDIRKLHFRMAKQAARDGDPTVPSAWRRFVKGHHAWTETRTPRHLPTLTLLGMVALGLLREAVGGRWSWPAALGFVGIAVVAIAVRWHLNRRITAGLAPTARPQPTVADELSAWRRQLRFTGLPVTIWVLLAAVSGGAAVDAWWRGLRSGVGATADVWWWPAVAGVVAAGVIAAIATVRRPPPPLDLAEWIQRAVIGVILVVAAVPGGWPFALVVVVPILAIATSLVIQRPVRWRRLRLARR